VMTTAFPAPDETPAHACLRTLLGCSMLTEPWRTLVVANPAAAIARAWATVDDPDAMSWACEVVKDFGRHHAIAGARESVAHLRTAGAVADFIRAAIGPPLQPPDVLQAYVDGRDSRGAPDLAWVVVHAPDGNVQAAVARAWRVTRHAGAMRMLLDQTRLNDSFCLWRSRCAISTTRFCPGKECRHCVRTIRQFYPCPRVVLP